MEWFLLTLIVGVTWWILRRRALKKRAMNSFLRAHVKRDDLPLPDTSSVIKSGKPEDPLQRIAPEHEQTKDDVKIVGVAQPVGFWTKFVMGEKGEHISALLEANQSKETGKGFWQAFVTAQRSFAGKMRGGGRQ
jgi:hypothetical protein